jgi:hypothetical protein
MAATPLHDGERAIRSVSLIALFKNNSSYLEWLFPRLEAMEAMYDLEFRYFFYTNDNSDDTAEKLSVFMAKRAGKLCSESLGPNRSAYDTTEFSYGRVKFLADLRTTHLAVLRASSTAFVTSDWTLFLDSQVYFEADVLQRLMTTEPRANNIAVLTCNTKEVRRNQGFNPCSTNPVERQPFYSHGHYYDTYALVEPDGRMYYPMCRFPECKICEGKRRSSGIATYDKEYKDGVVDVRTAFGGLVMIPTRFLIPDYVEWKTTEMKWGQLALCEHIYFMDMVRASAAACAASSTSSKPRVVIVSGVDDVTWIK